MADERTQERKLDEIQPGGYYIGTDGKPHDAEGKPIAEGAAAKSEAPTDQRTPANPPLSRSELEAMDKADLEALAAKRQLEVTGTGANGKVLKADLVDALASAE